jgi:uncharacterized protein (TIGR03437 family)
MTAGKRILFSALAGLVPMAMFAHKDGPDPRHTAAPGDDPLACSTAGCHTGLPKGGPLNSYGGSVSATFSTGSFYTPGQPVTVTVSVADPNPPESVWHGFQMSARLESNLTNGQAGTFQFTSDPTLLVLCDDGSVEGIVRIKNNACPANAPVEFIEHSMPSTGTWTFTWIPPANGTVPVHFYVAGNAVNNNDQPDAGDHVYTKEYVLRPLGTSCAQSLPVISQVRRIEGWGDGTTFSSGSWLEIKGSNLAQATGLWFDADFNAGVANTSLGGTSVLVNGKPGLVEYISPTQINLQAPADPSTTGLIPVTVTTCAGISKAFTDPNLQKVPVAPGILAPGSDITPFFTAGGKQLAEATIGFSSLFVGNPNSAVPGLFQPAKPGDSILLYAIGLGDTTPGNTPGVIASGSEVVNASVVVKFGTTTATVKSVALYPTFVGLYYIIVTVPPVADGDYQINVTVGGQPLQQGPMFLTVHK